MPFPRLISLHPKLAAGLDVVFSVGLIYWLATFKNPWYLLAWFLVRMIWWGILVQVVYYPTYLKKTRHLASLMIFNIGIIPYLIFADPTSSYEINIVRFFAVALPAVSFYLIPAARDSLSVMVKPHRRWKLFMTLFGVSGAWLAFEASLIFQILSGWQILFGLFGAILFTVFLSAWEWIEYGIKFSLELLGMSVLIFVLLAELGSIVILWPIGYLVSSFFITWIWYVVWLIFRFELSNEGTNWKKQRIFLISNLAMVIIFLSFIVRWK